MAKPNNVIQANQIFEMYGMKKGSKDLETIGCEDSKVDPAKVLAWAFATLLYLKIGQTIETSTARFTKVSEDLLQIETNLNLEMMVDELEHRGVIKIPV